MPEVHHKPAFDNAEPYRRKAVLETGIDEFSTYGFENANINVIAKKAGMSVGLMYKYFETKEDLFITCMEETLKVLDSSFDEILGSKAAPLEMLEQLIRLVQRTSRENEKFLKLYNEITKLSSSNAADYYAKRIESVSAKVYQEVLVPAREAGLVRQDADLDLFAFFFDNILTTLQFSYSCDYYKNRMKIFCGDEIESQDERVVQELMKFLRSAFGVSEAELESLK